MGERFIEHTNKTMYFSIRKSIKVALKFEQVCAIVQYKKHQEYCKIYFGKKFQSKQI